MQITVTVIILLFTITGTGCASEDEAAIMQTLLALTQVMNQTPKSTASVLSLYAEEY